MSERLMTLRDQAWCDGYNVGIQNEPRNNPFAVPDDKLKNWILIRAWAEGHNAGLNAFIMDRM